MRITIANLVWWKLFPITIGDTVKVISNGKEGTVVGMTVPMSHKNSSRINTEYYEVTLYTVVLEGGDREHRRRWEIEKVRKSWERGEE